MSILYVTTKLEQTVSSSNSFVVLPHPPPPPLLTRGLAESCRQVLHYNCSKTAFLFTWTEKCGFSSGACIGKVHYSQEKCCMGQKERFEQKGACILYDRFHCGHVLACTYVCTYVPITAWAANMYIHMQACNICMNAHMHAPFSHMHMQYTCFTPQHSYTCTHTHIHKDTWTHKH